MTAPQDREEPSASFDGCVPSDAQLLRSAHRRVRSVLRGKYRLERLLGVGSMAAVYAAVHTRNEGRVAIKVLHREFSQNDELCSRFLREGYLANRVSHPAVVHVLDDDITEDGSLFLVMELVDGETLEQRWARSGGKLAVTDVVGLLEDLLDALAAAHERGVVHRDIKPENVALTSSGQLKLLDFGIARGDDPACTRTFRGTVFGTPGFMSPEQALGRTEDVDALSDLWSVGAMAFSLLSGRLVHVGESAMETLARAALTRAKPLSTVAPEVPRAVAQVIDRALAFDKARRWPSARAMREALLCAAEERAAATLPPSLAPVELAPSRSSWTPPPQVMRVAVEDHRWTRDLRRFPMRPFLLALLAAGVTALAATVGPLEGAAVQGATAPLGIVSPAVPDPGAPPGALPVLAPLPIQKPFAGAPVIAAPRKGARAYGPASNAAGPEATVRRALPPLPPLPADPSPTIRAVASAATVADATDPEEDDDSDAGDEPPQVTEVPPAVVSPERL